MESDIFYDFVCCELNVLSDQHTYLPELKKNLHASQKNKILRGEIVSIRKILDAHFHINSSRYDWENGLPVDMKKHCEDMIYENRVSVRTLVFYWNMWKENVVDIIQSIRSLKDEGPDKHEGHVDFSLNYFGVRKLRVNGKMVYLLMNKDADWIRNGGQNGLHTDGKRLTIDIRVLVFAIRSYWQSELISVGIKVLETFEVLRKSSLKRSAFHQSTSLLHIYEVSKFLLDCPYLNLTFNYKKILQSFLRVTTAYFDIMFPLDWRESVSEDLISIKDTDLSFNLLHEIILQNLDIKGDLNYLTIGKVMMICFVSRKPVALYEKIMAGLQWNPAWKSFFKKFVNGYLPVLALQNALEDTYKANFRVPGYMSVHSFVYLLEQIPLIASVISGVFFATRSSFIGWFTHFHSIGAPTYKIGEPRNLDGEFDISFIVEVIQQILYSKDDTVSWIQASKINHSQYHQILALKLVMILTLICLKVSDCYYVLLDLLSGEDNIAYLLPKKFVHDLLKRSKGSDLNLDPEVVAEAFLSVKDPLLIASPRSLSSRIHAPCAIFVELGKSKEEIVSMLLSEINSNSGRTCSNNVKVGTNCEPLSSNMLRDAKPNVGHVNTCETKMQMNWKVLEEISELTNGNEGNSLSLLSFATTIKNELHRNIHTLVTALVDGKSYAGEDIMLVRGAVSELKVLSSVFDVSEQEVEHSVTTKNVQDVVERVLSRRPMIDDFLKHCATSQETKVGEMAESDSSSKNEVKETSEEKNPGADSVVEAVQSGHDAKNKIEKGKKKNNRSEGKKK